MLVDREGDQERNASDEQQSSPVAMVGPVWSSVSIKERLQPLNPKHHTVVRYLVEKLNAQEDKGVGKGE